jgi:hypothetical protein
MSDEVDNVITFPGREAGGRPALTTGRELRVLSERLHLLSCGLRAISPRPGWTAGEWMIASTQFRMRCTGTCGRLARLTGMAGVSSRTARGAVDIGYACMEAERALQAVGHRLDDLIAAAAGPRTPAQAARAFRADQRAALTAIDGLRRAIVREVSGT